MAFPLPENNPSQSGCSTTATIASPEAIKEELITQLLKCWLAKAQPVAPDDGFTRLSIMDTTDSDTAPEVEDGTIISCGEEHKFISFKDCPATDPQLKARIEFLKRWRANPANKAILVDVENLLKKEARQKILSMSPGEDEIISKLDGPNRIDQYTKLCAHGRLMELPTLDSAKLVNNSNIHECKLCICSVDKHGAVSMTWANLPWFASLGDFVRTVNDTPAFELKDAIPGLLKRLDFLDGVEKVAYWVAAVKKELLEMEASAENESEAAWAYSLCDAEIRNVATRSWTSIVSEDDFVHVLGTAKREKKLLLFIRPWQERLYRISREIKRIEHSSVPLMNDPWDPLLMPPGLRFSQVFGQCDMSAAEDEA